MTKQPTLFKEYDLTKRLRFENIPYWFCDWYAVVYNFVNQKKKFNYVDMKWKLLLWEWVDYASSFKDGTAIVSKDSNWKRKENLIDTNWSYLLKSWVDYIWDFSEWYAVIETSWRQNYIDRKWNLLFDERYDAYLQGHVRIYKPYELWKFSWWWTAVKKDGKWNFINERWTYFFENWNNIITFWFSEWCAVITNINNLKIDKRYIDLQWNILFENTIQQFIFKIKPLIKEKIYNFSLISLPFENWIAKILYTKWRKHFYNYFDHSWNFIFDDNFLELYDIVSHNEGYFIVKNKDWLYNCVDIYWKFISNTWYVDIKITFWNFKVCRKQWKKVRWRNLYKWSEWNIIDKKWNPLFKDRYNEIYYIKDDLFKIENHEWLQNIITTWWKLIFDRQDYIWTLNDETYFVIEDKNWRHLSDRDWNIIHPKLKLNRIWQFRWWRAPVWIYDDEEKTARNFMNYQWEFLLN